MLKKTIRFSLLSFALLSLSGCSLTAPKIGNTPTPESGERSPFDASALPGSVWRSDDGGKSFTPKVYVDEKRKFTKADVLDISFLIQADERAEADALRRTPDVYVGTVDDGVFKTVDGAEVWEPVNFPPKKIYSFISSRRSVDRMYATGSVGERGKIFRTVDGGDTWQDVYTEPGTGTTLASLAEHPKNVNLLFAGTSTGTVVKSLDGGDTWKNVGGQVNGPITVIAFDAVLDGAMYLLSADSKIYFSGDGGESWNDLDKIRQEKYKADPASRPKTPGVMPQAFVSLITDPYHSGTFYAGTKSGMFRSRDFGMSWEKVNIIESAEKFSLRSFAVNPKNSNELIFAAGRAFYKSLNAGETWSVLQLNTDREISVIAYDPVYPETIYFGLRKMK